jgi:uncharacterized oligopeptide transporter (OPT) family protein
VSESRDVRPQVVKPPGAREFTMRAVITAVVVAAIMGASYPYVVLKLGFGPNVSVVAAFLGYVILGLFVRNFTRWENNIVETAGTAAAQTAFMCVILAAFDFVAQNTKLHYSYELPATYAFLWLTCAALLGLLMAVPLRRHYVVEEQLTYADGVAAAETITVLDARGPEARAGALALGLATLVSAAVWLLTQKWGGQLFGVGLDDHGQQPGLLPEIVMPTMFGLAAASTRAGFAVSLLGLGSGMIVGNRINISMAIGGVISWIVAPKLLAPDIVHSVSRGDVLLWVMWPGTGMLIAAGITSLLLKWRTLARTFSNLSTKSDDSGDEFPLAWVKIGVVICATALVVVQFVCFDLPIWLTLIAIVLSAPLMLVGLRVLGETNWGPISQLINLMQAIFAAIVPGKLTTNLLASGTTGTIATSSEAIMQDYKCAHIIGTTPRYLTYAQLIAAPIGAAAVAFTYQAYKDAFGIGGDNGLSSPISIRIAGFADVLSSGFDALPKYSLAALAVGIVVGILIALGEVKWRKWLPSATGLGIGMMVPGNVVFTMVLGGLLFSLWQRVDKKSADRFAMPLASGLIGGEAVAAVVVAGLVASGVLGA